jgi:hypothetical protein
MRAERTFAEELWGGPDRCQAACRVPRCQGTPGLVDEPVEGEGGEDEEEAGGDEDGGEPQDDDGDAVALASAESLATALVGVGEEVQADPPHHKAEQQIEPRQEHRLLVASAELVQDRQQVAERQRQQHRAAAQPVERGLGKGLTEPHRGRLGQHSRDRRRARTAAQHPGLLTGNDGDGLAGLKPRLFVVQGSARGTELNAALL